MSKERIYIFDTTLRDGAQTEGVNFSLDDKNKIAKVLSDLGVDYFSVIMKRENLLPTAPKNIPKQDTRNFDKHFKDRQEIEIETFGNLKVSDVFHSNRTISVDPLNLNSGTTFSFLAILILIPINPIGVFV